MGNIFSEPDNPKANAHILSCDSFGDIIKGDITFEQTSNKATRIYGKIEGLKPGNHGFHIHETNDLSKNCESLGSHYNPFHKDHGPRLDSTRLSTTRHMGDLGNIVADSKGTAKIDFIDSLLKVSDLINRSVIVHEKEDDLGLAGTVDSKKSGSSGTRIGYGIIRIVKE